MIASIIIAVVTIAGVGLYILKPRAPRPPRVIDSVADLESYLECVVKAQHPPGLSVAVVKDGHIIYARGFGIADRFENAKATSDSVYHWWSMTKIPTALAIPQLHERGLIDIDDAVDKYLPFKPGSETRYSNWGYMILGAIVEAVAGQAYEDYVVDNILRPLDMDNTNFVYTSTMADNEAMTTNNLVCKESTCVFLNLINMTEARL